MYCITLLVEILKNRLLKVNASLIGQGTSDIGHIASIREGEFIMFIFHTTIYLDAQMKTVYLNNNNEILIKVNCK